MHFILPLTGITYSNSLQVVYKAITFNDISLYSKQYIYVIFLMNKYVLLEK